MGNRPWREVALEDVAQEITVGFVGSMASEYVDRGVPFLRSLNIDTYRIDLNDVKYISEDFNARIKKSSLSPGDVVIVRTGKPGTCAVIPESLPKSNCSDLVIVRPGRFLDARFLAYYVNSVAAHHVASHLVGAVQQHFNIGSARIMRMMLPEIQEQKAISHVLGSLDDKIELNRQINETLEEMARTLFRSWFVDFDPVRAKAEGRQPEGMDTETAALFPSEFVESELGMIPKGWDVKPLSKTIQLISGGTPKTSEADYWGGSIPWFSIVDAPVAGSVWVIQTEKHITDIGLQNSPTRLLPTGTTIISARGTVGKLAMVGVPMAMNQSCYGIQGNDTATDYFTYYKTIFVVEGLKQKAHGSVFDTITRETFDKVQVIAPEKEVSQFFDQKVQPILQKIRANSLESQYLCETRDSLLTRLISGEIRLPEDMIAEFGE